MKLLYFKSNQGLPFRWTFHPSSELEDTSLYANLHTYSGGGFFFDLSLDQNISQNYTQVLHDNSWIDRGVLFRSIGLISLILSSLI